jgi:branched-chain amino acid transport system substrate-binding protein
MGRLTKWIVAAVLASTLAACGSSGSKSTPATPGGGAASAGADVLIGNIVSNTGQYSIVQPADIGLQIAVDEINAKGGVTAGGKTHKLVVKALDDKSDPATSAANARELLQGGAKFIFGPGGAGSASVLELTRSSKIVLVTASSAATAQIGSGQPQYLLTSLPSAADRAASAVSALKAFAPTAKKMVIVGSDDATMAAVVTATTAAWTPTGGTVTKVLYPPGTSDLSGFMAKVKAENPDVLYLGQNPQSVTLALKQLDAAGVPKSIVIVGHGTEPTVGATNAPGRPYIAIPFSPGPLSGDGANPVSSALVAKYLAKTGQSALPAFASPLRYYYDIVKIMADAMTKAGTVDDPQKVLDAVLGKNTGYEGALGSVQFTPEGFVRFPMLSTFVAADDKRSTSTWKPGS